MFLFAKLEQWNLSQNNIYLVYELFDEVCLHSFSFWILYRAIFLKLRYHCHLWIGLGGVRSCSSAKSNCTRVWTHFHLIIEVPPAKWKQILSCVSFAKWILIWFFFSINFPMQIDSERFAHFEINFILSPRLKTSFSKSGDATMLYCSLPAFYICNLL